MLERMRTSLMFGVVNADDADGWSRLVIGITYLLVGIVDDRAGRRQFFLAVAFGFDDSIAWVRLSPDGDGSAAAQEGPSAKTAAAAHRYQGVRPVSPGEFVRGLSQKRCASSSQRVTHGDRTAVRVHSANVWLELPLP